MRYFPHDIKHQVLIQLLQDKRKEAGLYQADLADKLDRPQSYVSKIENGERRLDFVDVYLLTQALGVNFTQFSKMYEKALSEAEQ